MNYTLRWCFQILDSIIRSDYVCPRQDGVKLEGATGRWFVPVHLLCRSESCCRWSLGNCMQSYRRRTDVCLGLKVCENFCRWTDLFLSGEELQIFWGLLLDNTQHDFLQYLLLCCLLSMIMSILLLFMMNTMIILLLYNSSVKMATRVSKGGEEGAWLAFSDPSIEHKCLDVILAALQDTGLGHTWSIICSSGHHIIGRMWLRS